MKGEKLNDNQTNEIRDNLAHISPSMIFNYNYNHNWASQVVLVVPRTLSANAEDIRDMGLIPGSERSPERGHGKPLQYSCLENPMDRRAWQAIVHRIAKS